MHRTWMNKFSNFSSNFISLDFLETKETDSYQNNLIEHICSSFARDKSKQASG